MANRIRGEVNVSFDGRPIQLRPTFQAIADAEDRLGRGVIATLLDIQSSRLKLKDAVIIIHACAVAAGEDVTEDEVSGYVMDAGLVEFLGPLADLLMGAVGGNPPSKGTRSSPGNPSKE